MRISTLFFLHLTSSLLGYTKKVRITHDDEVTSREALKQPPGCDGIAVVMLFLLANSTKMRRGGYPVGRTGTLVSFGIEFDEENERI